MIGCKEYNDTREKLAELVFKMQTFTEEELTAQLREARQGSTEIGRGQTIYAFLDELREIGVLGFKCGRYSVNKDRK